MKKAYKIAALSCAVLMTFSTAAYAKALRIDTRGQVERNLASENDIFCDDFASATGGFENFGYSTVIKGDSTISIATTTGENGKNTKALLLSDKVPGDRNEGVGIIKSIGTIDSGTIGVEMKFKMEVPNNTETSFASNGLYLRTTDGQWATRFYVLGDATGGSIRWDGDGGGKTYQSKITPGAWYTFKMVADLDNQEIETVLESSALPNGAVYLGGLTFLADFLDMKEPAVSSIFFESRMFTADWYIEYLKVTKDPEPLEKPKPQKPSNTITPPVSATPVMRPVPDTINVMRNGTYAYFAQKPELVGEDVMVTARGAFNVFGMNMTIADGKYTGTSGSSELVINTDGSGMTINGSAAPSGSYALQDDGTVLVSLNAIADALGETAEWNETEQTLYISGSGAGGSEASGGEAEANEEVAE